MAPVMEGNLNFSAIFHALEASNCKYMLVEQDDCYGESPFDCLKTSYEIWQMLATAKSDFHPAANAYCRI